MKDVIKEILEANEKAKNDIENVEKLKIESAQRVKDMLNSRRLEYIDKAKMNIKVISKAEVEMKRIEKECEDILCRIEKIYLENKDLWVNTIFNNVVGNNYD